MTSDETKYLDFIQYVFDRPIKISNAPEWYWDINIVPFVATKQKTAELVCQMCLRSDRDLESYTNQQVALGLNYIFNNSISDVSHDILDQSVDTKTKKEALLSIKLLYKKCFEKRCESALSHNRAVSLNNPINGICYMLWDVSPLASGGDLILDVMESALYSSNLACIESGLHGLGHQFNENKNKVAEIIEKFLNNNPNLNPELLDYAEYAKLGRIQ